METGCSPSNRRRHLLVPEHAAFLLVFRQGGEKIVVAKRKLIDWDSVEPLYRAGSLSLSGICAQYMADHINSQVWKQTVTHAAILKKAKAKGWTRNLAGKVQKRIKEKLVTELVTSCNQGKISDDDMVELAAEAGSKIVLRHRGEIASLIEHEERLLEELKTAKKLFITQYQGDVVKEEVDMTVKEKSACLKDLAAVRAQRIALERQAHNLGDQAGTDDVDGIIVEFVGAGK